MGDAGEHTTADRLSLARLAAGARASVSDSRDNGRTLNTATSSKTAAPTSNSDVGTCRARLP